MITKELGPNGNSKEELVLTSNRQEVVFWIHVELQKSVLFDRQIFQLPYKGKKSIFLVKTVLLSPRTHGVKKVPESHKVEGNWFKTHYFYSNLWVRGTFFIPCVRASMEL